MSLDEFWCDLKNLKPLLNLDPIHTYVDDSMIFVECITRDNAELEAREEVATLSRSSGMCSISVKYLLLI